MPYALKGNSVVRSDSGEVVKTHPTREKALRHLRALKANVEEGALAVLGSLLEGFDAGEARDFHGRWLRTVAALKNLKVGESHKASRSFDVTRVAGSGDRQYRVTMRTNSRIGDRQVYAPNPEDAAHAALGRRPQPAEAAPNEHRSDEMASGPLQRPTEAGMRRGRAAAAGAQSVLDDLTAKGWTRDATGRLEPPAGVQKFAHGVGPEGAAARGRGASSLTTEHADTRDKLANLPVGQTYGLHGPQGQVGRVERTANGWEVYGPHEAQPTVHKTPSSAAGYAMRIQRSAAQSRQQADVAKRNYAHQQEVARMDARQSQRAEAEAERARQIAAREGQGAGAPRFSSGRLITPAQRKRLDSVVSDITANAWQDRSYMTSLISTALRDSGHTMGMTPGWQSKLHTNHASQLIKDLERLARHGPGEMARESAPTVLGALIEAFDVTQPRGFHGRWIKALDAAGSALKALDRGDRSGAASYAKRALKAAEAVDSRHASVSHLRAADSHLFRVGEGRQARKRIEQAVSAMRASPRPRPVAGV